MTGHKKASVVKAGNEPRLEGAINPHTECPKNETDKEAPTMTTKKCSYCNGLGKVKDSMGEATAWFYCGVCHGTGEIEC